MSQDSVTTAETTTAAAGEDPITTEINEKNEDQKETAGREADDQKEQDRDTNDTNDTKDKNNKEHEQQQQQQSDRQQQKPVQVVSAPLNFVFGQNLQERVILPVNKQPVVVPGSSSSSSTSNTSLSQITDHKENSDQKQSPSTSSVSSFPSSTTTGAIDATAITNNNNTLDNGIIGTTIAPVLTTPANRSLSPTSSKRKYETIITGEEDESKVLQIHCKLFQWQASETIWKEKGKGILRLNDRKGREDKLSSRLIMRTAGTLNVILNCSLTPGMNLSKSSDTSIKFTCLEGIFSVKVSV